MADDYGVDLDEVTRVIERAEVLVVRFETLEKRLLVDFRTSATDGPAVALVERVNSAEERFRHLKSMRPRFALPDRIMSFPWPRAVRALEDAGVWTKMRDRLLQLGAQETEVDAVQGALHEEEAGILAAAIRGGARFRTLWERGA